MTVTDAAVIMCPWGSSPVGALQHDHQKPLFMRPKVGQPDRKTQIVMLCLSFAYWRCDNNGFCPPGTLRQ